MGQPFFVTLRYLHFIHVNQIKKGDKNIEKSRYQWVGRLMGGFLTLCHRKEGKSFGCCHLSGKKNI